MTKALGLNRIDGMRPDGRGFGPLSVGVQSLELRHAARPDVLRGGLRDRLLRVELWYPSATGGGAEYPTLLRDGQTGVVLRGRAGRGAKALEGAFPLVILSHGFPGNRMLLGHFGEFLASHGYRVASIDHEDSTYGDAVYRAGKAFPSTLVNRAADTGFVAAELGGDYAIIGYSMGGYGALVAGGALLSQKARDWAAAEGFDLPLPAVPPRLKAILPIGPWGRQRDFWDAAGLAQMALPMLLMAGSLDAVSDYGAMRRIWQEAGGERFLLTFQGAGHNAAAPIPAPAEAWQPAESLGFSPFDHYADPVWDSLRMNNIAQDFALWFLDWQMKAGPAQPPEVSPGLSLERAP